MASIRHGVRTSVPVVPVMTVVLVAIAIAHRDIAEIDLNDRARGSRDESSGNKQHNSTGERDRLKNLVHGNLLDKGRRWMRAACGKDSARINNPARTPMFHFRRAYIFPPRPCNHWHHANGPRSSAHVQRSVPPAAALAHRPGRTAALDQKRTRNRAMWWARLKSLQ